MADATGMRRQGRAAGAAAGRPRTGTAAVAAGRPWVALAFVLSVTIPVYFSLGSLRLSPYRVILLLALLPAIVNWLSGRAGPVRGFDVMIVLAFLWGAFGLLVNMGLENGYQPAGILFIEAAGAYLLARTAIRSLADFTAVARLLFLIVLAFVPIALYEARTGSPIVIEVLRQVMPAYASIVQDTRLGLERVQGVFEHSILFGAYCSSAIGLVLYTVSYGSGLVIRAFNTGIVAFTSFLSISGGALVALFFQFGMHGWNLATRMIPRRWTLLALLFALMYVVVDLLSNRTPFHVFISYMTFSAQSSYNRILIWEFGSAEVMRHPVFGIGFRDWQRPSWMSGSIDNFWLLIAMRHGLPAIILFGGATLLILRRLSLVRLDDPVHHAARAGYLISLGGMIFAGFTVHYWNALFVWFMFLLGAGAWLLDVPQGGVAADPAAAAPPRRRTVLSDPPSPRRGG